MVRYTKAILLMFLFVMGNVVWGSQSYLITPKFTPMIPAIVLWSGGYFAQGMVVAQAEKDIWSDDAKTKVIPKGSRIVGHYEGGTDKGKRVLQVIWDRASTSGNFPLAMRFDKYGVALCKHPLPENSKALDPCFSVNLKQAALLSTILWARVKKKAILPLIQFCLKRCVL